MNTFNLIEAIYGLTGLAMVFFYIPQIKLLAQTETMATSISIPTWSIWSLGNLTNFIYGYLKLGDIKFKQFLTAWSSIDSLDCLVIGAI